MCKMSSQARQSPPACAREIVLLDQLLRTRGAGHVRHGLGVAARQDRDDTHVGHAEAVDAHHPEVAVDGGVRVPGLAHLHRACHVPAGGEVLPPVLQEVLVGVGLGGGKLAHVVLGVGAVFGDAERVAERLDGRAAVERVRQELGVEPERHVRVGRLQRDFAPGLGVVQEDEQTRIAESVLGEVRDESVNGEVGQDLVMGHCFLQQIPLLVGRELLELLGRREPVQLEPADTQLAGELGPGSGAVLLPLLQSLVHRLLVAEEGATIGAAVGPGVDQRDETVIAKTLPDGGNVLHHGDVVLFQLLCRPDAGMHEDSRRVERPCAQDDLFGSDI